MKDENGRDLIPLAAEARRMFNLHTRVTRPRRTPPALVALATATPGPSPQSHNARRPKDHRALL